MPRYFFDIYNGQTTPDPEGLELPDDGAAIERAKVEARGLAAESVRGGHLVGHHRIEVLDETRRRVGVVRFDDAVAIR